MYINVLHIQKEQTNFVVCGLNQPRHTGFQHQILFDVQHFSFYNTDSP